jgi:AraC-like DNA-binding protein
VRPFVTLDRQVSASVGLRSWNNVRPEPIRSLSVHPTVEVAWSEGPEPIDYVVEGQSLALRRESIVVIPARTEHRTTLGGGARGNVIAIADTTLEEMADAMAVRSELRASIVDGAGHIVTLCTLILRETQQQRAGHDLALDALTEALAVELLRTGPLGPAAPERPTDPRIRRALELIQTSFAEPLSLDAIAKAAGMSRFHFGRTFEQQVGKSPYRYLVDVRIARAAALLRSGKVSVTEAAFRVGYTDLGRFGQAFRARLGVSPREALAASRSRATPAASASQRA